MSSLSGDGKPARYATYKPKRHSKTTSQSSSNIIPNWTAAKPEAPVSPPANSNSNRPRSIGINGPKPETSVPPPANPNSNKAQSIGTNILKPEAPISPPANSNVPEAEASSSASASIKPDAVASSSVTSTLVPPPAPAPSTFRRVRPHASSPLARPSLVSVPNQNLGTSSPNHRPSPMLIPARSDSIPSSAPTSPTRISSTEPIPEPIPNPAFPVSSSPSPSLGVTPSLPPDSRASTASPTPAPSPKIHRTQKAPYRPGFQPGGKYRHRTDEFIAARKVARDGPGDHTQKRIERTKLERRLEKIIALHFPDPTSLNGSVKEASSARPRLSDPRTRTSSFFETLDIRKMGSSFLTESIRSAEQRISPWQPDSAVSRCPHCDASFHPLSNRKHHCRLCGRVICALGVKRPQRLEPCSILFVVDPKTRQIEQVEEGVDYGVRKRTASVDLKTQTPSGTDGNEEEEKFLKGVRICRECKPVLLRQQYIRERTLGMGPGVGEFLGLYDAFLGLEKEIEDSLPQFEELVASLALNASSTTDDPQTQPSLTAAATAERKRLLKSFTEYDTLARRIRELPCNCKSCKESRKVNSTSMRRGTCSQERVQAAIAVRAARFLEARMVGLGAVPTQLEKKGESPHKRSGSKSKSSKGNGNSTVSTESALHAALQPLLEQESLLESYVAEATRLRKFEDANILRGNLKEIRGEIANIAKKGGL
ncbi:FYVE zinc finger-domain-containing protein [Rhodocollybia butyracea]|uniref:FYVE zinc finger-domain-containing protein n=1 Tax=Rhodocollybia butyracea TaxID=206335 RepID=A0A9P5PR50_9AGAR|nr:FYVE zinc finger-domain-containing protein [Rhodocollybia butyracea]